MQTKPSGPDPDLLKTRMVPMPPNFPWRIVDKRRNSPASLNLDPACKPSRSELVISFVYLTSTVGSPRPSPFIPRTAIRRAYRRLSYRYNPHGCDRSRNNTRHVDRLDSHYGGWAYHEHFSRWLNYDGIRWSDQRCHFYFEVAKNLMPASGRNPLAGLHRQARRESLPASTSDLVAKIFCPSATAWYRSSLNPKAPPSGLLS